MAARLHTLLVLSVFLLGSTIATTATLKHDYYAKTCPDVEKIVRKAVEKKFKQTFVTLPAVLRAYFHDSSNHTPAHKDTERTHHDNLSLAPDGFDTINKAKEALEKNPKCKGKVSCADIFTIAARDVVQLSGGPFYKVELGRYDSRISKASKVRLPGPEMNLSQQIAIYKTMGLDVTDLAALSMAHSFGFSHCDKFSHRLYNFNGKKNKVDPTLNQAYAMDLKKMCPKNVDPEFPPGFEPGGGSSKSEDDPDEAYVQEEARQTLKLAKDLGCSVADEGRALANFEEMLREQRASYRKRCQEAKEGSKDDSDRCSRNTSKGRSSKVAGKRQVGFSKFSRIRKVAMRGKKKAL